MVVEKRIGPSELHGFDCVNFGLNSRRPPSEVMSFPLMSKLSIWVGSPFIVKEGRESFPLKWIGKEGGEYFSKVSEEKVFVERVRSMEGVGRR